MGLCVPLFFGTSTMECGQRRRVDVCQVGGVPRLSELLVDLWEEWGWTLVRGLLAALAAGTIHRAGFGGALLEPINPSWAPVWL